MEKTKNVAWQKVARTSTVSHALWPREWRRSPAVDERVQQEMRRSLDTARSSWWMRALYMLERAHFFYISVVVALGLASITTLVVLLYGWPVDLVFFCVSGVAAATVFFLMVREGHVSASKTSAGAMPDFIQATPHMVLGADPETPLPAMPLVRVLETIDLSACPVEHFLEVPDTVVPQEDVSAAPPPP